MGNNISPSVFVILLNYKGYEDTIACFESLLACTYNQLSIVIVDNCSPDDSFTKLQSYLLNYNDAECFNSPVEAYASNTINKSPVLIQSCENNGYGHGNNIGIRYAINNNADYVLILNNDTIVTPNFLKPLVEACEKDNNIGIASGKIFYFDQPNKIWYAGGKLHKLTAKAEHFDFGKIDIGQTISEPTTFITGCLWLIPSKVFKSVGFINEEYFMYVEDLEFCHRLACNGFTLKVLPESKIFHKVSSSTGGALSEFSIYWSSRNKIKFVNANFNGFYRASALIYSLIFPALRWIYNRSFKLLKAHLMGALDGFRNIH